MKKLLSFALLVLTYSLSFSQENYYKPNTECDLYCRLNSVRKDYEKDFYKNYISSCSFVKFTVDASGNVQNIEFNKGTPDYIAKFAKNGLLLTNGNCATTTTKPFILPIVYEFRVGKSTVQNEYGTVEMNLLNMLLFTQEPTKKNTFMGAAETEPLDCVILKPFYLSYLN